MLPVGAVENRSTLVAPPHDVAAVDHQLGAPALDRFHDLAGNPVAALEPVDHAAHAGKQFHIFD
jgi:hypothetical protein